nr:hypothetical protein [Tanacetum cinerariifolium]
MIIKKDSKIVKAKVERKSLALKAKKESSDEECSTSSSEDEEYAMATFPRSYDDKNGKSDRKFFRCGDPNHLIRECPKLPKDKNQRTFVGGSWSDSGEEDDEKVKNKTCLIAQASSKIYDSGCSKHMMGNQKLFISYKAYNEGNVIFGSNLYGNIIGKGQICDNKCRVTFSKHDSEITKDGKVIAACTPQSNGMVERKNRTLQEMTRSMLNEQSLPQKFWCNVVDTLAYTLNRILIRAILGETPYEPLKGYSQNSKAYIILNKHTRKVEESLNVTFDETPLPSKTSPLVDDDLDEEEAIKVFTKKLDDNGIVSRNKARMLLSYACALDSKLFQMDVKSAFLNGVINEEVYVAQPRRFINFEKPDHVYKLKQALYGLKQAPKAWPDIMFSVCLCDRFQEAPKTSHLEAVKRIFQYIKGTTYLGLWYPKGAGIETVVYADSDHAGDYVDQKSTSSI